MDSYERAKAGASFRLVRNIGTRTSARGAPTTLPSPEVFSRTAVAGINGRRGITMQVASVEYLPDNEKLQLPLGLFAMEDAVQEGVHEEAVRAYNTFRHVAGVTGIDPENRYEGVNNGAAILDVDVEPEDWLTAQDDLDAGHGISLTVAYAVGFWDDARNVVPRADLVDPALAIITFSWGAAVTQKFIVTKEVLAGTAAPQNAADMLTDVSVLDQICDFVSEIHRLNFSIADWGFLMDEDNRWADAACQSRSDETQYVPRLSSYTLSMIAALNHTAMGGISRLAWCRSYGVAVGLLPDDSSLHNPEYQTTCQLPESVELTAVVDDHPTGEEGQKYLRGCLSLIAAFGALHLANDHTYKGNDESLLRKAGVMVEATRTAMRPNETTALANQLKTTMRTMAHCFGLSATLGTFYDGRVLRFLAEPLQIRDTVVPPPIAKVGLVCSELNKIFALPIGAEFKKVYGKVYTDLVTLRSTVVANAAHYSNLAKHYGYTDVRELSPEENQLCDDLLPVIAGYVGIFSQDADGKPIGAALSQNLRKVSVDSGALVELYGNAFQKYVDKSVDLKTLISGETATEESD